RLAGDTIGDVDERGEPIIGDTLLLLLNAHHEKIPFTLPLTKGDCPWKLLLDTARPGDAETEHKNSASYELEGRSFVVLVAPRMDGARPEKEAVAAEPTAGPPVATQVERLLQVAAS